MCIVNRYTNHVHMVVALLLHDNCKFSIHTVLTPVVQISEDCSRGEDTNV